MKEKNIMSAVRVAAEVVAIAAAGVAARAAAGGRTISRGKAGVWRQSQVMTSYYKPNKVTVLSLWLESGLGEHLPGPALPLLMVLPPAVALTAVPAAALAADIMFSSFVLFLSYFFFNVHKIKKH